MAKIWLNLAVPICSIMHFENVAKTQYRPPKSKVPPFFCLKPNIFENGSQNGLHNDFNAAMPRLRW